MAEERQSEDYPLLGDIDVPSPSRSLTGSRIDTDPWTIEESGCPRSCEESEKEKTSDTNSLRNYHKPVAIHQPKWPPVNIHEALAIPIERLSPKTIHSQSSMDSGCDCDPSECDAASHQAICQDKMNKNNRLSSTTPTNKAENSDPSCPSLSSSFPLSSKSSLERQCDQADQKYFCDNNPSDAYLSTNNASTTCGKNQMGGKVTFKIEGDYEIDSVYNDLLSCSRHAGHIMTINAIEAIDVGLESEECKGLSRAVKNFPRVAAFSKTGMLSSSSSTASMPMCRICHLPQGEGLDMLISPCRCAGTMQFIHEGCLTKWLEISSKRAKKSPTCELCNYQFNRHKKFRMRHWKLPSCSLMDKILHIIFLVCIIAMATSASITIYCFKQDKYGRQRQDADLTQSDIITLTCGVLFFAAFFVAMYVEVKTKDTIYRLLSRFLYLNQTWHIGEYDKAKDIQASHSPV